MEEKLAEAQKSLTNMSDEHHELQERVAEQKQEMDKDRDLNFQVIITCLLLHFILTSSWDIKNNGKPGRYDWGPTVLGYRR